MEPITFRTLAFLVISLGISVTSLFGQTIKVRAGFLHDSIRIGDEVPYHLTASYPINEQVLFPDSTFDFSPLEFRRKEYFPTRSTNTTSYDSVVYYLTSFGIDRVQKLSLPVYQLAAKDCTQITSNSDSILIQQLVPQLPDSLRSIPVRASMAYQEVDRQINFPLFLIGYGVLVLLTAILWILFGEKIRKHYRLKKLYKAHAAFVSAFEQQLRSGKIFSRKETEDTLALWKRYMEQLSTLPYTRMTTPETLRLEKDITLAQSLRSIDAAIYGNATPEEGPLIALKGFADQRFNKKIQEVKNG
jgi:hypothetical protein